MWNYSMRDIPTLKNHAEATKHYHSITPLASGRYKDKRPVGSRKKTHQQIAMESDGSILVHDAWGSGAPTNYVHYFPDGKILLQSGSYSSGMGFIGKVIGRQMNQENNNNWIRGVKVTRPDTGEIVCGIFPLKGVLQLRNGDGDDLWLENPTWPTMRRTNRAAANEVRKRYAGFIAYARGVISLNEGVVFPITTLVDLWDGGKVPSLYPNPTHPNLPEFLRLITSDNPRDNYKAAVWVARTQLKQSHSSRWGWRMQPGNKENDISQLAADTKYMINGLHMILLEAHADEVFFHVPCYEARVV